jgi:peroxiredoxin
MVSLSAGFVAFGLLFGAAEEIAPGLELVYSGKLTQPEEKSPAKSFSYHAVILAATDDRMDVAWQVEERGGGGWQWPERFGEFGVLAKSQKSEHRRTALLHEYDGTDYAVALPSPVFEYRDKLQADAQFREGQVEYTVTGTGEVSGRECFRVEAALPRSRRQTLAIEKASGLLVSLNERLFLGQGVSFELQLELQSAKTRSAEELASWNAGWSKLLELQTKLARNIDRPRADLSPAQFETAQAAAKTLPQALEGTPWEKLAGLITRDLQQQSRRLSGVAGLEKKYVGQPFPEITLRAFDGEEIESADWKGQIVVLHFWEYPGDKLAEPYGQVGYLDFLYDKRKKLGVKVIGVAVDSRFTDPAQKSAALRSVRKLQQFMNLAYDLVSDDGAALSELGDPRKLNAKLPLWIVVGADGKIAHYKTGLYELQPDEGLKQLDEAVLEAVKKRPR